MKTEIYLKGTEVLSSTEQVLVFAKLINGKEVGAAAHVNITHYESKNVEAWMVNDIIVERTIDELKKYKKVK